jgi:hypothetical protein
MHRAPGARPIGPLTVRKPTTTQQPKLRSADMADHTLRVRIAQTSHGMTSGESLD